MGWIETKNFGLLNLDAIYRFDIGKIELQQVEGCSKYVIMINSDEISTLEEEVYNEAIDIYKKIRGNNIDIGYEG